MPISVTSFEQGTDAVDRQRTVLECCVKATEYILYEEDIFDVEVKYGKGWATYHNTNRKRGETKYSIKYGADCFERGPNQAKRIYVVSKGSVIQVSAKAYPKNLYVLSIIIEETAHHFQSLNEGRKYGSVHNAEFLRQFLWLWMKYSDEVMDMVDEALS